ncbi:UNVERIFIED_CONTAM: hypothetical protein FKN15_041150 [Acipenser sinensis]
MRLPALTEIATLVSGVDAGTPARTRRTGTKRYLHAASSLAQLTIRKVLTGRAEFCIPPYIEIYARGGM